MYQSNTGVILPTRIPSASTPLRSTEHQLCKWWIFLPEPQSWLGRISVGRVRGWGTEEPTTWGKAKWARVWIWEPEPKPGDKKKKKKKKVKRILDQSNTILLWQPGGRALRSKDRELGLFPYVPHLPVLSFFSYFIWVPTVLFFLFLFFQQLLLGGLSDTNKLGAN